MLFWHRRQYNGIIPPKDATKKYRGYRKNKRWFQDYISSRRVNENKGNVKKYVY